MNTTSSAERASRLEIAANDAVSLQVVEGAAIQCVSGRIWLTQEGDSRDYCIPAGVTFCADRGGRAVLSAIGDAKAVVVHRPRAQSRCYAPGTLAVHSFETIERDARAAQATELAHLVARAAAWLRAVLEPLRRRRARPAKMQSAC